MEQVIVRTGRDGLPSAVLRDGRQWDVAAPPVRWYERINWWEVHRRMPRGAAGVDVEVLQLQVRLGRNRNSALTTMVLERDGLGGGWRLRGGMADAA